MWGCFEVQMNHKAKLLLCHTGVGEIFEVPEVSPGQRPHRPFFFAPSVRSHLHTFSFTSLFSVFVDLFLFFCPLV